MKGAIVIVVFLLAIIIGYSMLSTPQDVEEKQEPKPFWFAFTVQEYGALDSGGETRGFLTAHINSVSAENATVGVLLLGEMPRRDIYEVIDYPADQKKTEIINAVEQRIVPYGFSVNGLYLEDAMDKKNSIIIISSDALPDELAGKNLTELIDGNVVIYFGKSFDLVEDQTGAQMLVGDSVYDVLDVSYDERGELSQTTGGPEITKFSDATILNYENGWLVLYPEPTDAETVAEELASLIMMEGWQEDRAESNYAVGEMSGARTFYSPSAEFEQYDMRIIYHAASANGSRYGMFDIPALQKPRGLLLIDEQTGTGRKLGYTFELRDNQTYPVTYDLSLQFVRDGAIIDTVAAKSVTIKTFSRESGTVEPNITAGSYLVRLIDESGTVHAAAYTHIPEIRARLVRIEDAAHVFRITSDGSPVENQRVQLLVNGKDEFVMHTDKNGEGRAAFMLAPGTHTFTVSVNGETATTRYLKAGDTSELILYGVLALGSVFMIAAWVVGSKSKRKWAVKTYHRPHSSSKVLRIPYDTFLELFRRIQEDRAKGLPLSISDLRIGLRKHSTYKGAPVFVTDSNLYRLLDGMAKRNRFLTYGGYFLPKEMSNGKSIEYWVLKRKLIDYFVEHGEEFKNSKDADFIVRGKMLHIWHDIDAKKLVRLCKKTDNVIIFPDNRSKEAFQQKMQHYDPNWMQLSLELQYGKLYCGTIGEFLEQGFHGKG